MKTFRKTVLAFVALSILGLLTVVMSPALQSELAYEFQFKRDPSLDAAVQLARSYPGQSKVFAAERQIVSRLTSSAEVKSYLEGFPKGRYRLEAMSKLVSMGLESEEGDFLANCAQEFPDSEFGGIVRKELLKRKSGGLATEFRTVLSNLDSNKIGLSFHIESDLQEANRYPDQLFKITKEQLEGLIYPLGFQIARPADIADIEVDLSIEEGKAYVSKSVMGQTFRGHKIRAKVKLQTASSVLKTLSFRLNEPSSIQVDSYRTQFSAPQVDEGSAEEAIVTLMSTKFAKALLNRLEGGRSR